MYIHYHFRWYFRKIKRIEAEKKLLCQENEHGAFLIRDSESRHNDYSLSGKYFIPKMNASYLIKGGKEIKCKWHYFQYVMVIRSNIIEFVSLTKVVSLLLGALHSGD